MSKAKKAPRVVTGEDIRTRTKAHRSAAQLASEQLYDGKIITLYRDTVRFPDGSVTKEFDIVRHPGASAIVPFMSDPAGDDPQLLLLRQYRYAADGYIYEIPAGRLDEGERPEQCAARELKEETGCSAEQFTLLTTMFTTPGFTDEVIHIYMATGLTHGQSNREADEFADTVIVGLAEALTLIQAGQIVDAKTVVGILYAAGFET